ALFMFPGAVERAGLRTDVFKLALRLEMERSTGIIFQIGFYRHGPRRRIQFYRLQLARIRAGINKPGDVFAVPGHDDRQKIAVYRSRTPITLPRSLQWMPFLRDCSAGQEQRCDHQQSSFNFLEHYPTPELVICPSRFLMNGVQIQGTIELMRPSPSIDS